MVISTAQMCLLNPSRKYPDAQSQRVLDSVKVTTLAQKDNSRGEGGLKRGMEGVDKGHNSVIMKGHLLESIVAKEFKELKIWKQQQCPGKEHE